MTALHLYEPVALKKDAQLEDSNGDDLKKATSCQVSNGNATSNETCALIVPVWLHHKDDPERETQVYAVLDDQSGTCFVTDEVCEKLGLKFPEVSLQPGTMHAVENINTMKINGLIASRYDKLVNFQNYTPEIRFPPERSRYRDQKPRKPGNTFVQSQTRFLRTIKTSNLAYLLAAIASKPLNLAK